jgi:hypothetical protein
MRRAAEFRRRTTKPRTKNQTTQPNNTSCPAFEQKTKQVRWQETHFKWEPKQQTAPTKQKQNRQIPPKPGKTI